MSQGEKGTPSYLSGCLDFVSALFMVGNDSLNLQNDVGQSYSCFSCNDEKEPNLITRVFLSVLFLARKINAP